MDHSPPPETNLRALGDHARVPFRFGARHSGASKPSWREGVTYLRRLVELRIAARMRRLAGFALVGALGVVVLDPRRLALSLAKGERVQPPGVSANRMNNAR